MLRKKRYRIVIEDESRLMELWSLKFTTLKAIVISFFILIASICLSICLIAFTPISYLLPGYMKNAKAVVQYVYETYGDKVFLSLMNQYTPLPQVEAFPEINRCVTEEEYDELVDFAIEIGVENGFIQEGETAKESFIPAFNEEGWKRC